MRRALGARKRDIRRQFLLEAALLSSVGGVIGVIFGVAHRARGQAGLPGAGAARPSSSSASAVGDGDGPARRLDPVEPGEQAAAGRSAPVRVGAAPCPSSLLPPPPRLRRERAVRDAWPCARTSCAPALTVLGIVVGVATVIAMVSIVTGFNNNMVRNFQSFGATLVQFQKFSMRFGPGHRGRHRAQPQGPDARGRPRAEGPDPRDPRRVPGAVPLRRHDPDRQVPRPGVHRADRRRRLPGLLAGEQPLRGPGPLLHAIPTSSTRRAVAVIGTDVAKALFPRESPLNKTVELNGWKYTVVGVHGGEGRLRRRLEQPLVLHSVLDLRPPVPADQGEPRRHDPHRDRAVRAGAGRRPSSRRARALLRARRHVPFNAEDDFYILTPDKMIESFQGITRGHHAAR